MKKLLTAFFALVLIGLPVKAADVSDLYYTNNGIFVAITGCSKNAQADLVIPPQIDGVPVWYIRPYAFKDCALLTSITIPDGADVGEGAFENCSLLSTVKLPKGITTIKPNTFKNCRELDFDIPETITSIGDYAFLNCGFRNLEIPKNVVTIGEYAFSDCGKIRNITIGEGVRVIKKRAFMPCRSLNSIIFKGNAPSPINPLLEPDVIMVFSYNPFGSMIINSTATGFGDTGFVSNFPLIVISVTDSDGDGVPDDDDAFPSDPSESYDSDNDGIGDNADSRSGEAIAALQAQINELLARPTVDQLAALEAERDARPTKAAYDAVVAERDARPTAEQLASVEAQRDARPTAEELAAVVAQRDALPTQAAYDAVIAERDARPTAEQLAAVEAERDAKLTTEEITDLRVGSVLIEPISGTNTAILSLDLEQSNNLKDWSTYKQLLEVIPVPEGIGFFRFALDK